ncbi:MAG: hypothetical protein WCT52_05125 [Candidatus Micrarchaeia archaeon]
MFVFQVAFKPDTKAFKDDPGKWFDFQLKLVADLKADINALKSKPNDEKLQNNVLIRANGLMNNLEKQYPDKTKRPSQITNSLDALSSIIKGENGGDLAEERSSVSWKKTFSNSQYKWKDGLTAKDYERAIFKLGNVETKLKAVEQEFRKETGKSNEFFNKGKTQERIKQETLLNSEFGYVSAYILGNQRLEISGGWATLFEKGQKIAYAQKGALDKVSDENLAKINGVLIDGTRCWETVKGKLDAADENNTVYRKGDFRVEVQKVDGTAWATLFQGKEDKIGFASMTAKNTEIFVEKSHVKGFSDAGLIYQMHLTMGGKGTVEKESKTKIEPTNMSNTKTEIKGKNEEKIKTEVKGKTEVAEDKGTKTEVKEEEKGKKTSVTEEEKGTKTETDIKDKVKLVPLNSITWLPEFAGKMASGSGSIYEVEDLGDGRLWNPARQNTIANDVFARMQKMGLVAQEEVKAIHEGAWNDAAKLTDAQKQQIAIFKLMFSYEGTRGPDYMDKLSAGLKDKKLSDVVALMQNKEKDGIVGLMGLKSNQGRRFWSGITADISKGVPVTAAVVNTEETQKTLEQLLEEHPSPLYDYISKTGGEPALRLSKLLDSDTKSGGTQLSEEAWDMIKGETGSFDVEKFNTLVQEVSGIYADKNAFLKTAPIVDLVNLQGFDVEKCKEGNYYSIDKAFLQAQEIVKANKDNMFFTVSVAEGKASEMALMESLATYSGKKYADGKQGVRNDEDGLQEERLALLEGLEKAGWLVKDIVSFEGYDETAKIGDTKYYVQLTGEGRKVAESLGVDVEDLIEDLFHNTNKGGDKETALFLQAAQVSLEVSTGVREPKERNFSEAAQNLKLPLDTPEQRIQAAKELNKGGKKYTDQVYQILEEGGARPFYYNPNGTFITSATQEQTQTDAKEKVTTEPNEQPQVKTEEKVPETQTQVAGQEERQKLESQLFLASNTASVYIFGNVSGEGVSDGTGYGDPNNVLQNVSPQVKDILQKGEANYNAVVKPNPEAVTAYNELLLAASENRKNLDLQAGGAAATIDEKVLVQLENAIGKFQSASKLTGGETVFKFSNPQETAVPEQVETKQPEITAGTVDISSILSNQSELASVQEAISNRAAEFVKNNSGYDAAQTIDAISKLLLSLYMDGDKATKETLDADMKMLTDGEVQRIVVK